jgi:cobalt/nickel transport protein
LKSSRRLPALLGAAMALIVAPAAFAHFQLLYTPVAALTEPAAVPLALVFSHPFDDGYTMNMGKPEAFYVVNSRGDTPPKTTDLMQYLETIKWSGLSSEATAYLAHPPKSVTRSLGDYTYVMRPAPYYEEQEDKYIQQTTKTVINIGGLPGNWDEPLGLPVEIVPLDKPYANWAGGVFRAVVLSKGKPVPHAEIEITYLNHEPQIEAKRFDPQFKVTAPQEAFKTMSIRADANGEVTIGLPKAGWWGICALNLQKDAKFQGKKLSMDAVLWVRAAEMTK